MFSAKRAIVHYNYQFLDKNPGASVNGRDLALIELDRVITPDHNMMPVCLPPGWTKSNNFCAN